MKGKRLLIMMSLVFLAGCQESTSSPVSEKKLYEGLDGKETYTEVVKYFNEHVTYYQAESTDSGSHSYNQYFQMDNGISTVTKALYSDAESTILNYNIVNGSDYHTLYMQDSMTYKYNVINDYTEKVEAMYQDVTQSNSYEILNVERNDQDNQINLELQVKKSQRNQEADETDDIVYYINHMTINKEGYISEEKITYYKDAQFKEISYEGLTTKYTDYNQKKSDNFDDEIELMKSCDGLNEDEIKDKIGLQW